MPALNRDGDVLDSPHRVAIVAHSLRSAGGLTVGRNLIEAIVRAAPDNEYSFVVPADVGYEEVCNQARSPEVHTVGSMGPARRFAFDGFRIPRILTSFAPDVVLALDSSHSIRNSRWPQAVLVHDSHLVYPRSHFGPRTLADRLRHWYLRQHFRRSLPAIQEVFVQTAVMASRLRETFACSAAMTVLGTSVTASLAKPSAVPPIQPREVQAHDSQFKFLCVTRYYPHKNLERIVDVFERFRSDLAGTVVFITVSPDQHRGAARLLRRIDRLGLGEQIVNLGEIPHASIGQYYYHCDALLMPTTLESYATPYVEAMAFGLPLLTSDLDFAREVCGEAAVYFDPRDEEDIKRAMIRVSSDANLRHRLANSGVGRDVPERSWTEIATTVLSGLYRISSAAGAPDDAPN